MRLLTGNRSLPRVTREDVAGFYTTHYVPNEMLLAVVGDFSAKEMEGKLRSRLGTWKKQKVTLPEIRPPQKIKGRQALLAVRHPLSPESEHARRSRRGRGRAQLP